MPSTTTFPWSPAPEIAVRTFIMSIAALSFAFLTCQGYRHLSSAAEPGKIPLEFTATRTLPANWRLQASDLKYTPVDPAGKPPDRPSLAGKYFIGNVPRAMGQTVKRDEIDDRPVIVPQAGRFVSLVSLKEQPELLSILNAGSTVALCASTCVEEAKVAFVWCVAADNCFAAVSLSEDEHETFKQLDTFRILLQGS